MLLYGSFGVICLSMKYGFWNNKYYIFDGSKMYIYPNTDKVASVLLIDYKINYLKKELSRLKDAIEYNTIVRNVYFVGAILSLGGTIIVYSNNKSVWSFLLSCVLGATSLSLGVYGISKNRKVYYDSIASEAISDRIDKEVENLVQIKNDVLYINLSTINSSRIINDLESDLSIDIENRLQSHSLLRNINRH